ncbi:hypothetical protein Hanom_Chr00s204255g01838821 [Helianthus anomalus]
MFIPKIEQWSQGGRRSPESQYYVNAIFSISKKLQKKKGKITSFVLYLYITFQAMSFLTNVDRRRPLLGILLQV